MTAGERLTARLLRWGPLLAFLAAALPLPAYFLLRYFTATEEIAVWLLLAMSSLAVGSLVGVLAAVAVFLYRRVWERRLRERLAADGVTADEFSWFTSELTEAQWLSLKEMEARSPLLADAYRETLAARITAERVLVSARREKVAVEERLRSAAALQAPGRAGLEQELRADSERISRVEREAAEHSAEIDARLQTIEALAGRNASEAETEMALLRLGSVREHVPLGLETARQEREARDEVSQELRRLPQQGSEGG